MTYTLDGKKIIIKHYLAVIDKKYYETELEFGSEVIAKLVYDDLIKKQQSEVEEFAKNQYMKGYRDGRAKKAKSGWFPYGLGFRYPDIKY